MHDEVIQNIQMSESEVNVVIHSRNLWLLINLCLWLPTFSLDLYLFVCHRLNKKSYCYIFVLSEAYRYVVLLGACGLGLS